MYHVVRIVGVRARRCCLRYNILQSWTTFDCYELTCVKIFDVHISRLPCTGVLDVHMTQFHQYVNTEGGNEDAPRPTFFLIPCLPLPTSFLRRFP